MSEGKHEVPNANMETGQVQMTVEALKSQLEELSMALKDLEKVEGVSTTSKAQSTITHMENMMHEKGNMLDPFTFAQYSDFLREQRRKWKI